MLRKSPGFEILQSARTPIYNRPPEVFGRTVLACRRMLMEISPEFLRGRWLALLGLQIRSALGSDRPLRFEFEHEMGVFLFTMRSVDLVDREKILALPDAIATIGAGHGTKTVSDQIRLSVGDLRRYVRTQEIETHEKFIGEILAPLAVVIEKNASEGVAIMVCAGFAEAFLLALAMPQNACQFVIESPVLSTKQRGSMELVDYYARFGRRAEVGEIVENLFNG